jgi:hypothetical protein
MAGFRWGHFCGEVILWAVRWYCRYGVSYRDLEKMLGERGVEVEPHDPVSLGPALRARAAEAAHPIPEPAIVLLAGR